jgi:hypothetical protein
MANVYINIAHLYKRMPVLTDTNGDHLIAVSDLRTAIAMAAAETGEVVGVVRCKDCRFCQNLPNGLCYAWTEPYDNERGYKGETHCVEPDDFCSHGERKERT